MTLNTDAMAYLSSDQIMEYVRWNMPSSEQIIRDLKKWKREVNRYWKILSPNLSGSALFDLAEEMQAVQKMINSIIRSERGH